MPLTRIDSAFLDLDAIGGIDFDVQDSVPTLKVEATNHRVGIGHNSPAYKLDVIGDVNISSGSNYLVAGSQISTANVAEDSSYLYYTDARAIAAVTGSALDMGSNTITTTGAGSFASLSTGASGVGVNISTSTISGPATLTIDPAAVGDNTGTVVIAGDLQVDGTTTTINSTTLTIDDKNIVLASGAADSAAADEAGITIDGANESLTWNDSNKSFKLSTRLSIGNALSRSTTLRLSKNIGGESLVSCYAILNNGIIQPDVTSNAFYNFVQVKTSDNSGTAYTIDTVYGYSANVSSEVFSADSTVTNLEGFSVKGGWTAGTNNYGFRGEIANAANRWNVYMDGTAPNYFAGKVGIGTDNPSGELHIYQPTGQATTLKIEGGSPELWFKDVDETPIFRQIINANGWNVQPGTGSVTSPTWGSVALIVDESGNVGIGTDNPTTKLQVKAGSNVTTDYPLTITNSAVNYGMQFGAYGASNKTFGATTIDYKIEIGGNLILDTTGNVGIGTADPQNKLHVKGTIRLDGTSAALNNNYSLIYQNSSSTVDYGLQLRHYQGDTGDVDAAITIGGNGATREDNIVFYRSNGSGASTETMRIDEDGNVGIGTDSSSYDLDVWGNVNLSAATQGGGSTGNIRAVDTSSNAADAGGVISFSYLWNDPAGALGNPPYIKAVKTSSVTGNYGGGLAFGTRVHAGSQLERMRIVENGNVGIGEDTPTSLLHLTGGDIRVDKAGAVDGILGEAYSGYFGLKHADQTLSSEYMIISADAHTYISASAGKNVYIRYGGNDSANELIIGSGNDSLTWRGGKVFHAGNSSPVDTSDVNTNSTEFPFKSIKLTGSGIGDSYNKRVILIIPRVTTNSSSHNKCVGKITASKTGGNVFDTFDVSVQSVYNSTEANFISMGQNLASAHKWVTCTYNGTEWIAIEPDYTANPYNNFWFHGQHEANDLDEDGKALEVISYYNVSTSSVINSEINNSIADWNSSQNRLCFNSSEIATLPPITQSLARSAGWVPTYSNSDESSVVWNYTEDAVEIKDPPGDTQVGAAYKAVKLKSGDKVRINVQMKGSVADTDGVYIRLYFYNGTSLPDGKTHVSNSASHPLVQEDSAGDTSWKENSGITTSYVSYARDYTAAADGYLSIVILNWSGYTGSIYVKEPIINYEKVNDANKLDGLDSGSFLRSNTADTATGTLTVRDIKIASGYHLQRSDHNSGHLEGSYNNVGANSQKSNPIYTIGSSYNPADSTLGNMYGIGYSNTNASFISLTGASGWGMYVAADGDARIYLSGSHGNISCTGTLSQQASDGRLKTNVVSISDPIKKLKKIRGVEFDWVEDITSEYDYHPDLMHETGVIAQEIQEVIPDAVATAPFNGNYTAKSGTDHNFLTVQRDKIVPLLIEAMKEQQTLIESLTARIEALENT